MKIYFDNREGRHEDTFITLFCDGECFGRIKVWINNINAVEIPDNTRLLRVRCVTEGHPSIGKRFENIEKEVVEDFSLPFVKETLAEKERGVNKYLKFLFDIEIELGNIDEDIVFYQATFIPEGAECILRYNVRKCTSGEQVPVRYVRREDNKEIWKLRIKDIGKFAGVGTLGILLIVLDGNKLKNGHLSYADGKAAFAGVLLGGMLLSGWMLFVVGLIGLASAPEKKMKSEYYLDSDGNWSSSEK